ncbi:MAG: isoprenylcysteine carboxylmethyltransferase family protein [Alphaproteobacteria bacterium]|nr:isoprenylcysteine carboxylmethyltransferase family protein [Alphaproteobacteria bacterium]MDE2110987.1 isoprenylcysteine carboxylmethyltransferase family protein [Alphaproteobacteria bacterium]MDE2493853.1 isoprenylcysteine carboxylmethyltransferase family protein [Alphaproteobacteria bacterium]
MTWANTIKSAFWLAFIGVLLFWSAGTLDWPGAWIFLAEMIAGTVVTVAWLAQHDPGLLSERLSGPYQKGQVLWDKVFMSVLIVVWYGWLALMGLDAKRWGTSHMPSWLNDAGAVLIPIGFLAVLWTFRENSFAAPVIKIQEERGQKVIDTGPYRIVRHPMYASALVYMLGMPLLLGSWMGLAALPVIVAFLIIRIFIEESTLRKGLPGYDDYAARVRYRLLPGVW